VIILYGECVYAVAGWEILQIVSVGQDEQVTIVK